MKALCDDVRSLQNNNKMITFYSDLLLAALLQHQVIIKELGNPKKRISGVPTDLTTSEKNISRGQSYNLTIQMDTKWTVLFISRDPKLFLVIAMIVEIIL